MSVKKEKHKKPRHIFVLVAPVLGVGGTFEHSVGSGLALSTLVGADTDMQVGKYISVWGTFRVAFSNMDYFSDAPGSKPVNVNEREYDIGAGGAVHPFGGKEWPVDLALKVGTRFLVLDNNQFSTWAGGIALGGSIRVDFLKYMFLIVDASWTFNAFHPDNDSDLGSLNLLGGPRSQTTYAAGVGFRAGSHAALGLGFEGEALELKATLRDTAAGTMSFMLKF
jgi:hypothetical protein